MITPEWNWFTKDGLPIYSRDWVPSLETKGVVCLVLGVGEHLGRFHLLGAMLAEQGFVLAGFVSQLAESNLIIGLR